jgi:hypothetical protein
MSRSKSVEILWEKYKNTNEIILFIDVYKKNENFHLITQNKELKYLIHFIAQALDLPSASFIDKRHPVKWNEYEYSNLICLKFGYMDRWCWRMTGKNECSNCIKAEAEKYSKKKKYRLNNAIIVSPTSPMMNSFISHMLQNNHIPENFHIRDYKNTNKFPTNYKINSHVIVDIIQRFSISLQDLQLFFKENVEGMHSILIPLIFQYTLNLV